MKFLWYTIPNMIICYSLGQTDELLGINSLFLLYAVIFITIVSGYLDNRRDKSKRNKGRQKGN